MGKGDWKRPTLVGHDEYRKRFDAIRWPNSTPKKSQTQAKALRKAHLDAMLKEARADE
jgi:hypothetical protein